MCAALEWDSPTSIKLIQKKEEGTENMEKIAKKEMVMFLYKQ
jgi:hypothetical protein